MYGGDLEQLSLFCTVIVSYLLGQHGNKISQLDILDLVFDHGLHVQTAVDNKVWLLVNGSVYLRRCHGHFDLCGFIHTGNPPS